MAKLTTPLDEQVTQHIQQLTDKIDALETNAIYQEETIEQLSETVGKQHQDIQQLQTQLRLLSEFIKNMKTEMDAGIKMPSEEAPPPHY